MLRLAQWPELPGSSLPAALLRPTRIIEALPGTDAWEWLVEDGREELDLSAGDGWAQVSGWRDRAERISTLQLLEALGGGRHQLNWGTLRAFVIGETEEVLLVSGFDSTWYDIEGRADLIAALGATFWWARVPGDDSPQSLPASGRTPAKPAEPVVLAEGGDVNVFASIEALIGYVEAIDVRDGVYRAFDATGRAIILKAPSDRGPVSYTVGSVDYPEILHRLLVTEAKAYPAGRLDLSPEQLDSASLDELLSALLPKPRRRPRWRFW